MLFPKQVNAQQEDVNFQIFYDELSPYGQWVDYSNYGYVWIPDVGNDFVPYSTAGRWVLTDYGWTWVSDYDWGWAPFHYGRWDFDDYYGWFWVPDNEWGPAWVIWRSAFGYYGWSPMEPGVSLSMSFGRQYNRQNDHWIFVRDRDIEKPDINIYLLPRTVRNRIILNSTVINRTFVDNRRHSYVSGPAREDVQRATGRAFKSVAIQENDRPGQTLINGQLRIFRPQIIRTNDRESKPVPSRIVDLKDVKRPSDRNQSNQPRISNPSDNNRQGGQQNIFNRRENNQQPAVPQNANPSTPDRRQQPQRTVTPQGNNPTPVAPQNVTPSIFNRRQQPQRTVTPQDNNPTPVVPQNVNPSTPDRRQQPQSVVTPQNNNNANPAPVPNAKPSGNNKRGQQKTLKSSNDKKQQPVQPKPDEEKKTPQ